MSPNPKLSNKQRKVFNKRLDISKELSLLLLSASFLKMYEDKNSEFRSVLKVWDCIATACQSSIIDSDDKVKLLELYKNHPKHLKLINSKFERDTILKVAENEMQIVEDFQRVSKPTRFKKVCVLDEDNELNVSSLALAFSLLEIHSNMKNRVYYISEFNQKMSTDINEKSQAVKNARIVATKFSDRIDKYYEDRKI